MTDMRLFRFERPVGLVITLYVYIVYVLALKYEGCVHGYNLRSLPANVVPDPSRT